MKQENQKNVVVLKDLPSNIVQEAIIVLKTKQLAKNAQKIEQNKRAKSKEKSKIQNEYIAKEAEMLVQNFASRVEEKEGEVRKKSEELKYKIIKRYAYIVTFILLMESIALLIK